MDNQNSINAAENRQPHWPQGLRPFLWWGLFVLMLYGYRQHQRLSEETRLQYTVALQQRLVSDECRVTIAGTDIMSGNRVPIGWHKLVISHPKAEPWTTNLFIWYGAHDLGRIALTRGMGTLAIQTAPPARVLTIRGPEFTLALTNSTGTSAIVPTDHYRIEAQYGHWQETHEMAVFLNTTSSWQFTPRIGDVQVTSSHTESAYQLQRLDGQLVENGELPVVIKELPVGNYKLVILHHGNQHVASVTVRAGITNNADVKLLYGTATLESDPTGATVLNSQGRQLGVTPLQVTELVPGNWTFGFRREGYEPAEAALDITANQTNSVRTKLVSSAYVRAMRNARQYLQAADCDRALNAVHEALRVNADDADALALQKEVETQRELQQAKTAHERLDLFIRNISEAITRGETENAVRQFTEAKKLFPDDPKVAELQTRMVPVFRDYNWLAATKTLIRNSPYCAAGICKYNLDLTTAREGVGKAISEALSFWRLKEEHKLNDQTIMMQLSARGMDQQRACILMLSEFGNAQVEIRYRICHYVTSDGRTGQISLGPLAITSGVQANPSSMRQNLDASVQDLLASFKRHLDNNK